MWTNWKCLISNVIITVSILGVQEEVITDDQLPSVEHSVVTMTTAVVMSPSLLPLDTANQDVGGWVADDEAEEDEMEDWWRCKGPSTTKPSTMNSNTQQPKWNSLKFTKQLKTRWGMTSVTMTRRRRRKRRKRGSKQKSRGTVYASEFSNSL